MFSADQIADIQGFNKVYQNLLKQILLTIAAQVIARHVYEIHGFYKVASYDKLEKIYY